MRKFELNETNGYAENPLTLELDDDVTVIVGFDGTGKSHLCKLLGGIDTFWHGRFPGKHLDRAMDALPPGTVLATNCLYVLDRVEARSAEQALRQFIFCDAPGKVRQMTQAQATRYMEHFQLGRLHVSEIIDFLGLYGPEDGEDDE